MLYAHAVITNIVPTMDPVGEGNRTADVIESSTKK